MSAPSQPQKRGISGLMSSTIGAKIVMALTGVILVGFVVQHMIMNLQLFAGPEAINAYAHGLKGLMGGNLVWIARAFLLACIGLHIMAAMRLSGRNREARKSRYVAGLKTPTTSYAAQFMLGTGIVTLLFLVYHILHFTGGVIEPEYFHFIDSEGRPDVWRMVVSSFKNPTVAVTYVIANIALALHLSHSVTSMFATLGLQSGRYRPLIDKIGPTVAAVVLLGNVALAVSVIAGLIHI